MFPLSKHAAYLLPCRPRWAFVKGKVWGSSVRDAKRLWRPLLSEGDEVSVSHYRAFRESSMWTGVMNQRYTATILMAFLYDVN